MTNRLAFKSICRNTDQQFGETGSAHLMRLCTFTTISKQVLRGTWSHNNNVNARRCGGGVFVISCLRYLGTKRPQRVIKLSLICYLAMETMLRPHTMYC